MYFHFTSSENFDYEKNYYQTRSLKPDGLWCSFPTKSNSSSEWFDFVSGREGFLISVSPRKETTTLEIKNLSSLISFEEKFGFSTNEEKLYFFDWKKVRMEYDCVFVDLSSFSKEEILSSPFLESMDVSSFVVLNLNSILVNEIIPVKS